MPRHPPRSSSTTYSSSHFPPVQSALNSSSDETIILASCINCERIGPIGNHCSHCPDSGFVYADPIPDDAQSDSDSDDESPPPSESASETGNPSTLPEEETAIAPVSASALTVGFNGPASADNPVNDLYDPVWTEDATFIANSTFPTRHEAAIAITTLHLRLIEDDVLYTTLEATDNALILAFRFSNDYPTLDTVTARFDTVSSE